MAPILVVLVLPPSSFEFDGRVEFAAWRVAMQCVHRWLRAAACFALPRAHAPIPLRVGHGRLKERRRRCRCHLVMPVQGHLVRRYVLLSVAAGLTITAAIAIAAISSGEVDRTDAQLIPDKPGVLGVLLTRSRRDQGVRKARVGQGRRRRDGYGEHRELRSSAGGSVGRLQIGRRLALLRHRCSRGVGWVSCLSGAEREAPVRFCPDRRADRCLRGRRHARLRDGCGSGQRSRHICRCRRRARGRGVRDRDAAHNGDADYPPAAPAACERIRAGGHRRQWARTARNCRPARVVGSGRRRGGRADRARGRRAARTSRWADV